MKLNLESYQNVQIKMLHLSVVQGRAFQKLQEVEWQFLKMCPAVRILKYCMTDYKTVQFAVL